MRLCDDCSVEETDFYTGGLICTVVALCPFHDSAREMFDALELLRDYRHIPGCHFEGMARSGECCECPANIARTAIASAKGVTSD